LNFSFDDRPEKAEGRIHLIHAGSDIVKRFSHVYIVGLADGIFPDYYANMAGDESPAMLEERRLFYKAFTSTENEVTLSYANQYFGSEMQKSRFIRELQCTNV
jgi:DNA helicase-2/ATP-dependent DNA helicase PcrA